MVIERPAYRSRYGKFLLIGGLLLGAAVLMVMTALLAVDHGLLDRPIAAWASRKLHRDVRFASFKAHLLSMDPHLEVESLEIANPSWAGAAPMARIAHLTASVTLGGLLRGRLVAPVVTAEGVSLRLIRKRDGHNNWTYEPKQHGGAEFEPLRGTRSLTIRRGNLQFTDEQRALIFNGRFQHGDGGTSPFSLAGVAEMAGSPVLVQASGGALNGPRIGDPYPFRARLVDGNMRVNAVGTSGQPFDFRTFDVALAAAGPNLADLGYLFNLRLPNSAPFTLRTRAKGDGPHFNFRSVRGRFGQSDMTGWVRSQHSGATHKVQAEIWSGTWTKADVDTALATLAPRALARSRSGAVQVRPPSRWILSDAPFPVQSLRGVDLDAQIHVTRLIGYALRLEKVSSHVDLTNGRLTYTSLTASLYGGRLAGSARLDVHGAVPVLSVKGSVSGVELAQLGDPRRASMSGKLYADLDLHGAGTSIHGAGSNAAGTASLRIVRGSLPPPAAFMLGGDTLRAIGSLGDSRKSMPLDCVSARFAGSRGRLLAPALAIQTPAGATGGEGWIDLADERLHFTLNGAPLHRKLLHVSLPIVIYGAVRRPSVTVLPAHNARKLGFKGKLGVALSPLAAVLPLGRDPAPSIPACR